MRALEHKCLPTLMMMCHPENLDRVFISSAYSTSQLIVKN